MVAYGPWIQDPDYTSRASRENWNLSTFGEVVALGSEVYGNSSIASAGWTEPFPEVDPVAWQAQLEAGLAGSGSLDAAVSSAAVDVRFDRVLNSALETRETHQGVTINKDPFLVRPGTYAFAPWPHPADVAGLEYEGRPYDPGIPFPSVPAEVVGLAIHGDTDLAAPTYDSTYGPLVGGDHFLPGGDAPDTLLMIEGGGDTLWQAIPGRVSGQLEAVKLADQIGEGAVVDLAALEPVGWTATIWAETPALVEPFDYTTGDGYVQYGWNLMRLVVQWTLRPVPYRWVYGTVPYRRVFPRDDGLAGGAPRVYPASKAVQSSNRVGGGYL